ncbi:MAG: hypothetical protein NTZ56_15790 [Acidobacteria bacterium]|nr:hypothetical protein [Acidobacteriota bacterium]
MRTLIAAFLLVPSALAQSDDSADLGRVRLAASPLAIAAKLVSSSVQERQAGLRQLGFDPGEEPPGLRVAVHWEQLDQDPEEEVVLALEVAGTVNVFVVDQHQGEWWRVARFANGFRDGCTLDGTLAFKQTRKDGIRDILIRTSGGGTDIVSTNLTIYQLREGTVRRLFHVVEDASYRVMGRQTSDVMTHEHVSLAFVNDSGTANPLIVADRTKEQWKASDKDFLGLPGRRTLSQECSVYRWSEPLGKFSFDGVLTRRICGFRKPLSELR